MDIENEPVTPYLIDALSNEDRSIRMGAAAALARMPMWEGGGMFPGRTTRILATAKLAIPHLVTTLEGEDVNVRTSAADALVEFTNFLRGNRTTLPLLEAAYAALIAAKWEQEAVAIQAIIKMLKSTANND